MGSGESSMESKTGKRVWLKLAIVMIFAGFASALFWRDDSLATKLEPTAQAQDQPAPTPTAAPAAAAEAPAQPKAPPVEGCLKCHNNIEPMHRFNASGDVYDTLKDGKDALGLSCTTCHGGNPTATTQEAAHVQPRYPKSW